VAVTVRLPVVERVTVGGETAQVGPVACAAITLQLNVIVPLYVVDLLTVIAAVAATGVPATLERGFSAATETV
jgi:hypothetical protein